MVRNRWIYSALILVVISFLTIGYSAFTNQLNIDNITAYFRAEADIRITNISVENVEGEAISNFEEYGMQTISSEILLPNENSSVTYKIELINFGGTHMVISDITGLQDNLEYSLDNYELNNIICDDNNKCNLGITKYIYLTIKYKNPPTPEDNTTYNINLNFEFTEFMYTINYYPNRLALFDEYAELDYIESSGKQYIVTDIIPTNSTGIYMKLASMNTDDDSVFLGSGTIVDDNRYWFGNASGNIYYGWNDLYDWREIGTQSILNDEINVYEMNYKNNRQLNYNGNTLISNLPTLTEKTHPLMIFGYNHSGNSKVNMQSAIKLYELKITENDDIIGNFIPCERGFFVKQWVHPKKMIKIFN